MQGDIGVARSIDKGATWQQLGIALDEDWHLSYPYVFEYNGNVRPFISSSTSIGLCHYFMKVVDLLAYERERAKGKERNKKYRIVPVNSIYNLDKEKGSLLDAYKPCPRSIFYLGNYLRAFQVIFLGIFPKLQYV